MQVEQQLPEGLNLGELLAERLGCGILVVGPGGTIKACNQEAEGILGSPKDLLTNQTAEQLPEALGQAIRSGLEAGIPTRHPRVELRKPGEAGPGSCAVSLTSFQVGAESWAVVLLHSPTLLERLDEPVHRLECLASIGTLSAGMAHEVKNALVAIKTYFEMLPAEAQKQELADVAAREVRRVDALISQMLRFAGPAKPMFTQLRVRDLVEHSLRVVQYQLDARRISVQRHFPTEPLLIAGDHYQLEQAVLNLLLNAVEAMPAGGELILRIELIAPASPPADTQDAKVCLSVQDSGPGISSENLARLFDPFFTTKPNGTGLGLAITRRIIHEHYGSISVQSEAGRGATFKILLPLSAA
jgi:signal transduction histidine kinase